MGTFIKLSSDKIRATLPRLFEARLPYSCMVLIDNRENMAHLKLFQIYNVLRLYLEKRLSKDIPAEFHAYNGDSEDVEKAFIVASQHRSVELMTKGSRLIEIPAQFFPDIAITTSDPRSVFHDKAMTKALDSFINWNSKLA